MSDFKIHDYSGRARRSLAVRTQAAALPPQPERHDGDHWDFGRRGFAHAYYPGMAGLRTGPVDPIVAAAREAALEAGVDPELVEDIDIEDLIVTPELISGTIGGISFLTSLASRPDTFKPPRSRYEATEHGGTIPLLIPFTNIAGGGTREIMAGTPGPIFATGCSVVLNNEQESIVTVRLGSHGIIAQFIADAGTGEAATAPETTMNFLVESPSTLTLTIANLQELQNQCSASAIFSYRRARRIPD